MSIYIIRNKEMVNKLQALQSTIDAVKDKFSDAEYNDIKDKIKAIGWERAYFCDAKVWKEDDLPKCENCDWLTTK